MQNCTKQHNNIMQYTPIHTPTPEYVHSSFCLSGSFTYIFKLGSNLALVLAVLPPAVYLGACFKLKSDTQITIAAMMSIIYALFMTATIPAIIGKLF